jgi:hypothetical protein
MGGVYRSIRDLMNLVEYEREGFGYILARSNDLLNYRKVKGFTILPPNVDRRCSITVYRRRNCELGSYEKCGRIAIVYALIEVNGKKYSIYMCRRHLKLFLMNLVKYVREKAKRAYHEILDTRIRMVCE